MVAFATASQMGNWASRAAEGSRPRRWLNPTSEALANSRMRNDLGCVKKDMAAVGVECSIHGRNAFRGG